MRVSMTHTHHRIRIFEAEVPYVNFRLVDVVSKDIYDTEFPLSALFESHRSDGVPRAGAQSRRVIATVPL